MVVGTIKLWIDTHITPFAWQRITLKLLPHFQKAGLYLHQIKDDISLGKHMVELINATLEDLYQSSLPAETLNSFDMKNLRGEFHKDRHSYTAIGEPLIFHCHHYNTYLQAVIEDTHEYLNVYPVLIRSAQEIVYSQFHVFFQDNPMAADLRKQTVQDFFRFCGFGMMDLSVATLSGGKVIVNSDHYAAGWKSKFGERSKDKHGVSFFTLGFIKGALEAIYDLPNGYFEGKQTQCIAQGASTSEFVIVKDEQNSLYQPSPAEGAFQSYQHTNHVDSKVDYLGIREALINMPLEGHEKTGLIDAFGVLLTRMYANYYCLISYRFLRLFEEKMGLHGTATACDLLTEAGHVCAFNTFGGIMQSAEWNGLIKPSLQSKEDWVHGIIAVVNALGWGFWELVELVPNEKLVVKIVSGYEANAYTKNFGKSSYPISFLATGGTAGIMNLIYNTQLTEKQITLDDAQYKQIYSSNNLFTSTQIQCRAMGDAFDVFEVNTSKP